MSGTDRQVAVITGVSSGLGRALALRFRQEGLAVVGICRSQPDIEIDLWIKADITSPADRKIIYEQLASRYQSIDVLINNAGKGSYATWEEMPQEDLRNLFEVNFFAPVLLTDLLLPMLRQAQGTIINISSVAGKLPVPCMGAYCAGKAAFNLFSDSLRTELRHCRVKVLKVMPGRIDTGFSLRAVGCRKPPDTPGGGDAEVFARKVFTAWKKGRRYLIYPWWYRLLLPLPKLFPGFYEAKNQEMWRL